MIHLNKKQEKHGQTNEAEFTSSCSFYGAQHFPGLRETQIRVPAETASLVYINVGYKKL